MKRILYLYVSTLLILSGCNTFKGTNKTEQLDQLAKLQELLDKGTITTAEFNKMKSEILGEDISQTINKDSIEIDSVKFSESTDNEGQGSEKVAKSPKIDNHEFVDLGLPSGTKWATCNVGATSPYEGGSYFAWGEIETKTNYTLDNYKWVEKDNLTKYCTDIDNGEKDNKLVLEEEDDAVAVHWGNGWRLPTKEDFIELYSGCNWEVVGNETKHRGRIGTSKYNGKTIYFPAGGCYNEDSEAVGVDAYYWTSSLNSSNSSNAYSYGFGNVTFGGPLLDLKNYINRHKGCNVRGVKK